MQHYPYKSRKSVPAPQEKTSSTHSKQPTLARWVKKFLRTKPLRTRLIIVLMFAILSVAALLGSMIIYHEKNTLKRQFSDEAKIISRLLQHDFMSIFLLNSPELTSSIAMKLDAFTAISNLVLFDREGKYLLGYDRSAEALLTPEQQRLPKKPEPFSHQDGFFYIYTTVKHLDKTYGTAFLKLSGEQYQQQLSTYYKSLYIVIPFLLLISIIIASALQRYIAEPFVKLANFFHQISNENDYSLRIQTKDKHEIKQVFDGVNDALNRIEASNAQLDHQKEHFRITLESIGDGIISTNEDGDIVYMNPAAENVLGWYFKEIQGSALDAVFDVHFESDHSKKFNPLKNNLYSSDQLEATDGLLLVNRSGSKTPISMSTAPIWDAKNAIVGCVIVIHDITHTREMEKKLSWQATHDSLTRLINREAFEQQLSQLLISAIEDNESHAILYMDMDQFKIVNDTCGHLAGDELLKQLSKILSSRIRNSDTLGRLGGDEFGILLKSCDEDTASRIAEDIRHSVKSFRFVWQHHVFDIGVSIGLVMISAEFDDPTSLLSTADMACFAAKDQGRNRVYLYKPSDAVVKKRYGEIQWLSRIKRALDNNSFVLYKQTILPMNKTKNYREHYEILVRMIENDEIITPGAFLAAAERFNLTPDIDRWVIRSTLDFLSKNPIHTSNLELCSINLSAHSLGQDDFLEYIITQFSNFNISPKKICFEITETAAVTNMSTAIAFISALKKIGCQFALDDFGSGMSSFAYLKNLDVDYLKIDGMFVKDILNNETDFSMVKSINEVSHIMGKQTIAEFVENDEILELLSKIGVDYTQGFAISGPIPLESTIKKLNRNLTVI